MSNQLEDLPGLQRLSLVGGVFYVHHNPPPEPEPEVELQESDDLSDGDLKAELAWESAADAEPESGSEYETASAGFAESGVGVLLADDSEREGLSGPDTDPELRTDPDPEPLTEFAPDEEPLQDPAPQLSVWGAPARPLPPGYAIEFGTGRLVPLQYMRGGARLRPAHPG